MKRARGFAGMLALVLSGCAGRAERPGLYDERETQLLSSGALERLAVTMEQLANTLSDDPGLAPEVSLSGRVDRSIEAAAKGLAGTEIEKVIRDQHFSAETYLQTAYSFRQALDGLELLGKAGRRPPPGLIATNIEFVRDHPGEARQVIRAMERLAAIEDSAHR